jgi:hypothetical protein
MAMALDPTKRERIIVDAVRRCLVCDSQETVAELEETDVVGPLCSRCHAPTERVSIAARRVEPASLNPHASALGRLGARRGGLARAAALSPKRRREIARAAALARWTKSDSADTST